MRLHSLTQKAYYYKPAVKATVNQLKEAGNIITNFVYKGSAKREDIGEKLLSVPVPYTKKCWFSDDYKLTSTGKQWVMDLLARFDLGKKASLSDLVLEAVHEYKGKV